MKLIVLQLQGIQDLLREEGNQRALQGQQQTDSVRYLNELNSVSPFLWGLLKSR